MQPNEVSTEPEVAAVEKSRFDLSPLPSAWWWVIFIGLMFARVGLKEFFASPDENGLNDPQLYIEIAYRVILSACLVYFVISYRDRIQGKWPLYFSAIIILGTFSYALFLIINRYLS